MGVCKCWEHSYVACIVPAVVAALQKSVIKSSLSLSKSDKNLVLKLGQRVPVLLIRNEHQTSYSKTKCRVDGLTQFQATLRSSTPCTDWNHEFITQKFKTLVINACHSYDICSIEKSSEHPMRSLDEIWCQVNNIETFLYFIHHCVLKLIKQSDAFDGMKSRQ